MNCLFNKRHVDNIRCDKIISQVHTFVKKYHQSLFIKKRLWDKFKTFANSLQSVIFPANQGKPFDVFKKPFLCVVNFLRSLLSFDRFCNVLITVSSNNRIALNCYHLCDNNLPIDVFSLNFLAILMWCQCHKLQEFSLIEQVSQFILNTCVRRQGMFDDRRCWFTKKFILKTIEGEYLML